VLLGAEPEAGSRVRVAWDQAGIRVGTAGMIAFLIVAAVLGWCFWTLR